MSKEYNPIKGFKLHTAICTIARFLVGWFICAKTSFSYKYTKINSDCFLLLSNHTTDLDGVYTYLATKRFCRFVAAANTTKGFPGCLFKLTCGPIPREKGAKADEVITDIKTCLEHGIPVAMYPEGNTSWDGETGYISKRTAQLVKESKGDLVTYKITGGYLKSPRWAVYKKKGKCFGQVVALYKRAELDQMSVDEIYNIITRDLYVNAYDEQKKHPQKYTGKNIAEGLESTLYVCPECHKIGTIKTLENKLYCSCGAEYIYDEEGYLNRNGERTSILDWSKWQKQFIKENAEQLKNSIDTPIYSNARIQVYGNRLVVDGKPYMFSDITKMSVFRSKKLFFSTKDEHIELTMDPSEGHIGQMFFALWKVCSDKEYL